LQRTQLDAMRTLCYHPGPLIKADLSDFAADLGTVTAATPTVVASG
jgi:hypothetical protein